jgi:hypothetical protein
MVIVRSLRLVQPAQQQRLELLNLLRFSLWRGTSHPHPHQPSLPWHVHITRNLLKLLRLLLLLLPLLLLLTHVQHRQKVVVDHCASLPVRRLQCVKRCDFPFLQYQTKLCS